MAKRDEKEIMDQLFKEMQSGELKNYDEMMKRKAELFNVPKGYLDDDSKRKKSTIYLPKVIIPILIIVGIFVYFNTKRDPISQVDYNGFKATDDPTQTGTIKSEFEDEYGRVIWNITPKADYKMVAKVKSKHHLYSWMDSFASISPYDLALAWGELIDPKYDKYISYRQSDRIYKYSLEENCPISKDYVSEHSSNTHIIAANDKVLQGVKYIKTDDIVYLEGNLVDITGKKDEYTHKWETSLKRDDNFFDAGCEVFYVRKLQIGDKVYE